MAGALVQGSTRAPLGEIELSGAFRLTPLPSGRTGLDLAVGGGGGGGGALHGATHNEDGPDSLDLAMLGGTLGVGHGGLGITTLPAGSIPYAVSLDHIAALAIGAAGKMLRSTGAAPAWSGWTAPNSFAAGSLPYAATLDNLAALPAPGATSVLTHTTAAPAWVTALAKAQQHAQTVYLDGSPVFSTDPTVGNLIVNSATVANRQILFRTNGVNRWLYRVNSSAESGSNAGSNFEILARDDAGLGIGTALVIARANMAATFGGALTSTGVFAAAADTDSTHALGRAKVFSSVSDNAMLAHYDRATSTAYALRQNAAGATWLNAITGQIISLAVNDSEVARVTATGLATALQITSSLATGTAPFAVASTTQVANLTSQYLGASGQDSAFHLALTNATGTLATVRGGTGADGSALVAHRFLASPSGGSGAAAYRAIVAGDLPADVALYSALAVSATVGDLTINGSFEAQGGLFDGSVVFNGPIVSTSNLLVGAGPINAAAAVQVDSTTQGVLLPRMTTTQRNAITSPPDGLLIYNTTTGTFQGRAAGAWVSL